MDWTNTVGCAQSLCANRGGSSCNLFFPLPCLTLVGRHKLCYAAYGNVVHICSIASQFVLKEDVSWFRWIGTLVIVVGIIIVALDDKQLTGERKIAHSLHENGPGSQNTRGNCQ